MSSSFRSRRAVLPAGVRSIDRRAGKHLYRAPTPAWVDEILIRVTAAAASGTFWVALTALLAVTGARGRRAALRGALTLAASSLGTNLVAKRLIRARRPIARGLRHRLQRVRTPESPSFPSGHSASAAAFAAGVAAESRAGGAVLGVLALLISFSRLHVGAHEISDVVAGNVVGGVVGVLGVLVRRPPLPAG